ncbi:hypothetical protein [Deinococcus sp.]|uniref:hypothetical protein n=1 Tax=Deinococcus sp. TaxID=47478 RepID=UPI0025D9D381|nr:hypothetical protein [Deinococcus sp.]
MQPAASRKRTLARELATIDRPVKKSDIAQLSTELAGKYAGKTQKSVSRDIKELQQLKLIDVSRGLVVTNWAHVLQLLPVKVQL